MKLLKPEWVHHDKKWILSIDVHPDGTKFATGGQGNDCGRVVIWNLEPLLSRDAEANESVPKVLCQMDNHLACVNAVRWSNSGSMLASASDDKIVMLWTRSKVPATVFGNGGVMKTHENWRCEKSLRGHNEDILDLAWSPQDRWLASCSVDNNIIVWDTNNFGSTVAVLKGHTGLVKGVTWDPVGKYLASQSDDQSVKVWRTSDWTCESTIKEPFKDCGGTTSVLRLSWSPDGLYLVSAHAMNGGGPTAQIIEREGWRCDKDFVGHRRAVSCVRFHPSILRRPNQNQKSMQYCCLAIGSRDKSLSVWTTAMQRPLLVIYDLFEDSVLDLAWSPDRHILLACSKDGTVACIEFNDEELGNAISKEEKNALYQKMYGKSANVDLNDTQTERGRVIEYAELMSESQSNNNNSINNNNHIETSPTPMTIATKSVSQQQQQPTVVITSPACTPTKAIHKQTETRTADGKRRITPMFIPPQEDVHEPPVNELTSSSRNSSNIVVENQMDDQMLKSHSKTSPAKTLDTFRTVSTDSESIKMPSPEINGFQMDNRLTKVAPIKTSSIITSTSTSSNLTAPPSAPVTFTASPTIPLRLAASTAGKAQPYAAQKIQEKIHGKYRIEFVNGNANTAWGPLAKITCVSDRIKRWELYVGSPIVNVSVCAKFVLICCADGTIQFIDINSGDSVFPKLKMLSAAIQCVFSINSELGGVVTECGLIRIWNLFKKEIFLSTNCYDLLNCSADGKRSFVTFFYVSECGVIYILLSNGYSYSFSKKLDSWVTLDSHDPIIRLGIASHPQNSTRCMKSFPVASIQTASKNFHPIDGHRTPADPSNGAWRNTAKLQFIEDQIKICEAVNSARELEYWYSLLGMHLAQHGTEARIRIILDDLLGVAAASSLDAIQGEPMQTDETIVGVNKHKILAEILKHLKPVTKWQRIYMEYLDQLNAMNT